jgi:Cu/Ag efflux protein CusF
MTKAIKSWALAAAAAMSILAAPALAAGDHAGGHAPAAPAAAAPAAAGAQAKLTGGEVRKVDAEQGKLTIKHEAIANLDMPPMTMVFRVAKPELLKDLKAGDQIRFQAESSGGAITVTKIEKAS